MEEEVATEGRQLRQSTLSHQPGRYEESQAYGVQIPSWVHPPIVFDHILARHCSFPSVPLDQPGRADAYVAARERGEVNEPSKDFCHNEGDEEGCQTLTADNNENDCNAVTHDTAGKVPKQGESLKEFLLAVTNDLDWGSPEPDDIGEPIEWCQITLSGQWILLLVLCRNKAFAPATQLLKMKITDIIHFVGLYIYCHRETKQWVKEIDGTPVGILLQMARGIQLSMDESNALKRPYLPTDVLMHNEREQIIKYLHQVGQGGFIEDVKEWRGHSTSFHTLPIEPEIMAACVMILDKGMDGLDIHKDDLLQPEQSLPRPGGVKSGCRDLAKCLAELQAYLPFPCPLTTSPSEPMPAGNMEEPRQSNHQHTKENGIGSSNEKIDEPWSNTQHNTLSGEGIEPAADSNCGQDFAQKKVSVAETSQITLGTINYRGMDELYDPQLLPRQRVPSVDLSGFPDFAAQGNYESIPVQELQPPSHGLDIFTSPEVPTIQIREASPQAESHCTTSCDISANRLLPPARSFHPPARLPGPNLGRDTYSFPEGRFMDMHSYGQMPAYTGTNGESPPTYALDPHEINRRTLAQSHPLDTSFTTAPGSSTPSFPPFSPTFHRGGTLDFHNPTDVQASGIPVAHQGRSRPDSQPNPSLSLGFADVTALQEPHIQVNSYESTKDLGKKTSVQAVASLPVASKGNNGRMSVSDDTQQKESAPASLTLIDDNAESPATLSSRKPTRRQRPDSDDEYQPRPKRPRKSNTRSSTSLRTSVTSFQPILPHPGPYPQPSTQLQPGTAGTIQPVKRGRGRPRKYPRPQDVAAQPGPGQPLTSQVSANDAETKVAAATCSSTSNGGHPASALDSSTSKKAGFQASTRGPTAATIPTISSTPVGNLAQSSPQYSYHTFQPYDTPHTTTPALNLPQIGTRVSRDVLTRPHPISYEEFWANHQNRTEAARRGRLASYAMPDIAVTSPAPSGTETTPSAPK